MKPTEVKCNEKALEALIAKTAKDAKSEVRCLLDGRRTERPYVRENGKVKEYGWAAYQRALMKNDHTIYVALPSMAVSVSDKPMAKGKLMKIESRERRAAERATKKHGTTSQDFDKAVKAARKANAAKPSKKVIAAVMAKGQEVVKASLTDEVLAYQKANKVGYAKAKEAVRQLHAVKA
ncbi:MAG: hypothetical protein WB680_22610 [Candidatus Acidiferrales bacterium]